MLWTYWCWNCPTKKLFQNTIHMYSPALLGRESTVDFSCVWWFEHCVLHGRSRKVVRKYHGLTRIVYVHSLSKAKGAGSLCVRKWYFRTTSVTIHTVRNVQTQLRSTVHTLCAVLQPFTGVMTFHTRKVSHACTCTLYAHIACTLMAYMTWLWIYTCMRSAGGVYSIWNLKLVNIITRSWPHKGL